MGLLPRLVLALSLCGCSHSYRLGVASDAPASEVAQMTFFNEVQLLEIDGQPFRMGFAVSKHAEHTVYLPPGQHRFKFWYETYQGDRRFFTADPTTLTRDLEAGRKYWIRYFTSGANIRFRIEQELTPPEKPG
jgi:hypothetical protein